MYKNTKESLNYQHLKELADNAYNQEDWEMYEIFEMRCADYAYKHERKIFEE